MKYVKILSIIALIYAQLHAEEATRTFHYYIDDNVFIPSEYFIAREYEQEHNHLEAEKYYLLAGARGDVWSYYSLGLMCERLGMLDKAEQYYTIPVKAGKREAEEALGRVYFKQNKYDLAKKYLVSAQEKGIDCAEGKCLEEKALTQQ